MKREDYKYIGLAELNGWRVLQNGREFKQNEDLTGNNLSFEKNLEGKKVILRKRHGRWNKCLSIDGQILRSEPTELHLGQLIKLCTFF